MGFVRCCVLALSLAATFTKGVSAEDVLYSRRSSLQKRGIDADGNYNISFFHINDVHAHLDEFSSSGTDCTRPERGCYGGYARVKSVIDAQRPQYNDSLFLNAGDEFQGTLFYTYYGGEKIAETLNQLNFSAMTLGNHEFDDGDDALGAFLENLTFPIISANIQSTHPVLNRTIKAFHIFEEYDLAVIGVTTEETSNIANPGEGTTFSPVVEAVQNTIDFIHETTNISRIAALTHIGYEEDQALAEQTKGLYLIMGGHSHTNLGDSEDAEGPYPTIVENADGEEVFIVTAWRWGQYLGYIDVTYDPDGKILAYHGGPIELNNQTAQDPDLQAQIDEWRVPFEEFAAEELGTSLSVLDQSTCQERECTLGNFMADAMLQYRLNLTNEVDFALINAGGIRAEIDEGPITRGEVLTAFPFGNAIVDLTFSGDEVWDILEGIISGVNLNNGEEVTSFFQVSRGIEIEYNPENGNGSKLVSVKIGNETLDREEEYTIVTLDFLAGGGDNFFTTETEFASLGTQDEVLVDYIRSQTPVNVTLEGRIRVVNGSAEDPPSSTSSPTGTETGSPTSTESAGEPTDTGAAGTLGVSVGVVAGAVLAALAAL
ncbi:Metallo-dependent phosphatase [Patellaria atrata CBS 101060]|uniref:Metallo-dependent phosphatase n=1 Tax=Patellaria atrata CBS 101060 TaxID=1346257 RepID=A0A9P4SJM5_9PEZI|nr:Metallo-dependent phosphatase [Patellaria atrata CBS 101060]